MQVLAILTDLLFRSKIETAAAAGGAQVRVAADAPTTDRQLAAGPLDVVIVDLELEAADPMALISRVRAAQPQAAIVGYCAHAELALQAQARRAGCAWVGPRSAFVQALPGFLGQRP